MIKCEICEQEFKSMITSTHLKKHDVSSKEYAERFGQEALTSEEYRNKRKTANSGKNNPMYGKNHTMESKKTMSENRSGKQGRTGLITGKSLENIREGIKHREERYNSGELQRPQRAPLTDEIKTKISKSIKEYAKDNHEELSERTYKAIDTKIKRYGKESLAFFKGKKHTPEAKEKMLKAAKRGQEKRTKELNKKRKDYIRNANLTLLNTIGEIVLQLKCNKCGTQFTFTRQYFTDSKFRKEICPTCYPRDILRSQGEEELYQFIKKMYPDTISNDRNIINPLEIDVYIPELKIGFEYNGLYWHSEEYNKIVGRVKYYDMHKQKLAKDKGIRIYTIYEDEWNYNQEIVKSRIKNILNYTTGITKHYARECFIKEINSKEANKFLKENHLQGTGRSNVRYGLYYANELVSVMTFSKENISRKLNKWEINRFCSKLNHSIVGGASKLFKHFLRDHNPEEIISYADSRWSAGNLYKALGFKFTHQTPPNYWYFKPNEGIRIHRFTLRKNKNDDPNLTEYENRLLEGYQRVWDCGSTAWIYVNE